MKTDDFNIFKSQLNIEEFKQFCYHHTDKEVVDCYKISYSNLKQLRKEYDIHTPKEITKLKRVKTWEEKADNKLDCLSQRVPKESLYQFYEVENHCWDEVLKYFNITTSELVKLINLYDLHKSTGAHVEKIKESKLNKYGDPNYNNRRKCVTTCKEKYNVENVSQLEWVKDNIKQTWIEHGYDHPMHVDEIKQKVINSSKLYGNDSKPNLKFAEKLDLNNINYSREFVLNSYRYDFKIDNILIEINPTIFHNTVFHPFGQPVDADYHRNKSLNAFYNGYRCIHVWDWDSYDDIIQLLLPLEKVGARKCTIKEISKHEAKEFINKYHLQKYTKDDIRIGLYYENNLVSVMTFGVPRYNKNFQYELIRYCSSKHIIGGAEKLFKYFIKTYSPKSIISYCDFSKFTGETYEKLGFVKYKDIPDVGVHWYKQGHHVLNNVLRQQGADRLFGTNYGKGTSNIQIALDLGYLKVCDAGQFRFEWFAE